MDNINFLQNLTTDSLKMMSGKGGDQLLDHDLNASVLGLAVCCIG